MKRSYIVALVIILVLAIDQILKIYIKTHYCLNQYTTVIDWSWLRFRLYFTENRGMAYGMQFGGDWGKLALSLFRLLAISGIAYYIVQLLRQGASRGYLACISLIFAGAIGNIIDSVFYGQLFSASPDYYHSACVPSTFMPTEGGYAPWLHGSVVDMLHVHFGYFPKWVPFVGGTEFFQPIFNVADAAISVGVFLMIVFYRQFFADPTPVPPAPNA